MHLYALIAISVPKLVAVVTPLCPLYTGVSQMNSPIAQTLSQNRTLHGYVSYNWSYGHFVILWLTLHVWWGPRRNHFHQNWSRGFRATGVWKLGTSIDLAWRPYNSSALPCWLWCYGLADMTSWHFYSFTKNDIHSLDKDDSERHSQSQVAIQSVDTSLKMTTPLPDCDQNTFSQIVNTLEARWWYILCL